MPKISHAALFLIVALSFWSGAICTEERMLIEGYAVETPLIEKSDIIEVPLNEYNFIIKDNKAIFTEKDPADKLVSSQKETAKNKEVTILYERWLDGYIKKGGFPTHQYNYPFERIAWEFKISQQGDIIEPLYGSSSRVYIVPEGVKITINGLGHNEILYMENFTVVSNAKFLPVCNDLQSPSGDTEVNAVLEKNKEMAREKSDQFKKLLEEREEQQTRIATSS